MTTSYEVIQLTDDGTPVVKIDVGTYFLYPELFALALHVASQKRPHVEPASTQEIAPDGS